MYSIAKQTKVYVNAFLKGGGCPEGKALGRSPQRAKHSKLTNNAFGNSVITNKSKGAIHIKTVKQNVRN